MKSRSRRSRKQFRNVRYFSREFIVPHTTAYKSYIQPSANGFITAMELGHQRKRVVKISTGSKQLDSILGGCVCPPAPRILSLGLKGFSIVVSSLLLFQKSMESSAAARPNSRTLCQWWRSFHLPLAAPKAKSPTLTPKELSVQNESPRLLRDSAWIQRAHRRTLPTPGR